MAARAGKTKSQRVAEEIARAVNAGKAHALETVDFSDPDRPKTCLEVDFPILPVNQVATIEGNAGKPIYQVSKWWARRRSSVFRSLLLAASMKAPDDPLESGKAVWDVYYGNHQRKGSLAQLKVVDPFMGGGTTIVEGSRLGMQMLGVDLNPIAWFVVRSELAQVGKADVEALLADIEAEVKPQIMPFYACDCPRGHRGKWTRASTGEVMGEDFNPLTLKQDERPDYQYDGPETVYVFWAKHGPCQVTGCGHRTPIVTTPVMAVKTMSIRYWPYQCRSAACGRDFDIDEREARLAPAVDLVISDADRAFTLPHREHMAPSRKRRVDIACPHCRHDHVELDLPATPPEKKKVDFSLLVHHQWLSGESSTGADGTAYGGSVSDTAEATAAWYRVRAAKMRLVEVRGKLPDNVCDPMTGMIIPTGASGGTSAGRGKYACGACGTVQDMLKSVRDSGKSPPEAPYAVQGYCPQCDTSKEAYGGRFFIPMDDPSGLNAALAEWQERKSTDLKRFIPLATIRPGLETSVRTPLDKYHYARWADFLNARQGLVACQLLRALSTRLSNNKEAVLATLSAFQQFLRSFNMFCIWNLQADKLEPFLSKNNLHPPSRPIENAVFSNLGRGNWESCTRGLLTAIDWKQNPWELVATSSLPEQVTTLMSGKAKSAKVYPGDPIRGPVALTCGTATDIAQVASTSIDLVITDPPFGDIMQYAELSDFFYAWLAPLLREEFPSIFGNENTPTAVEAVENGQRHGGDAEAAGFYKRVLTDCWREASRILKPGGILAFTFHHDKDGPWVAVLEGLFSADFYLEATYPIRSDETKGEGGKPGTFGAQKVEYDIIHVCRKRNFEPKPVSWAKMRRHVLADVRRLQTLLEHHQKEGLPEADLQVIRRGKALEYYSRHYGKVYVDEGKPISVQEALLGINQILDEELGVVTDPPPATAEPFTRQFLRLFDGQTEVPRDQMQKFLRGTGISPSDFEERGWCSSENKIYQLMSPVKIAQDWAGRHRRGMTSDYDQAAFLIGACFDNSGINATDTLTNTNFRPHPALGALLDWYSSRGATTQIRNAAIRARSILRAWKSEHQQKVQQMTLFFDEETAS